MPPLPRQHSAALGCTKYYQPIGVTVHLHCVEIFEGLSQRCRRGRDYSEFWKKTQFFLNTLYVVKRRFMKKSVCNIKKKDWSYFSCQELLRMHFDMFFIYTVFSVFTNSIFWLLLMDKLRPSPPPSALGTFVMYILIEDYLTPN